MATYGLLSSNTFFLVICYCLFTLLVCKGCNQFCYLFLFLFFFYFFLSCACCLLLSSISKKYIPRRPQDIWIWPSVKVSARIRRFAGAVPGILGRKIFFPFLNLPCYLKRNLHSDGPCSLFLEKEYLIACYFKRRAWCWSIIPQAAQANNWQTSQLKPGSHLPPSYQRYSRRYCLRCPSEMRTEVAGKDLRLSCCRQSIRHVGVVSQAGSTGGYVAGCFGGIWEPSFT